MRATCLTIALAGLALVGFATPGAAQTATGAAASAAADAPVDRTEALRAIHRLGEALQREASLPGMALAIGDSTGIVFSAAYGLADLESRTPATPLTRWRIGSVSKGLTAAGAALLAERGTLDLDASVASLLPSMRGRPAGSATVRQLAGHMGGVRHYGAGEYVRYEHHDDVAAALDIFADDTLVAPPGTAYNYSTYGYTLLSAVMAEVTGEPFLAWMDREVLRPLELDHTGPDLATRIVPWRASFYDIRDGELVPAAFGDDSYKWAGGGFLSTPEDLVRFGQGLLDRRLLGASSVESLFTSQRTLDGEETGYGMGFRPRSGWDGRSVVHHGGSSRGARAFLLVHPDEGVVVAMAANRASAPLFEQEAQVFSHLVLEHGTSPTGWLDDELTGTWRAAGKLGSDEVNGSLRLYAGSSPRGILEWREGQGVIRVVLVDRHDAVMRLVGVGPHGVMMAWLEPSAEGWSGPWEYLGREGILTLGPGPEGSR